LAFRLQLSIQAGARIRLQAKRAVAKTQSAILISLVSVHYQGGYINSIRMSWYVNLEQVFDSRANLTESQFGFVQPQVDAAGTRS
jgi:hypothetical protein